MYLAAAIESLKPSSEFTFLDEDYSTIIWHKIEGDAPTLAEINAEIARLKALEVKTESDRLETKSALLERLGITAEEAVLLLS